VGIVEDGIFSVLQAVPSVPQGLIAVRFQKELRETEHTLAGRRPPSTLLLNNATLLGVEFSEGSELMEERMLTR
jgi:hypothetical protein